MKCGGRRWSATGSVHKTALGGSDGEAATDLEPLDQHLELVLQLLVLLGLREQASHSNMPVSISH
jgi:hypothetical protein